MKCIAGLGVRSRVSCLLGAASALCLLGCEDADDRKKKAGRDCRALAELICDRSFECAMEADLDWATSQAERDGCDHDMIEALMCDRVVGVAPSYPDCVDQVPEIACDEEDTAVNGALPQACHGVLQILR